MTVPSKMFLIKEELRKYQWRGIKIGGVPLEQFSKKDLRRIVGMFVAGEAQVSFERKDDGRSKGGEARQGDSMVSGENQLLREIRDEGRQNIDP